MIMIVPTQTPAGWILVNKATGEPVQESYPWPSRVAAMDAARKLWPKNSVWHGRAQNGGWRIDDGEPGKPGKPRGPITKRVDIRVLPETLDVLREIAINEGVSLGAVVDTWSAMQINKNE